MWRPPFYMAYCRTMRYSTWNNQPGSRKKGKRTTSGYYSGDSTEWNKVVVSGIKLWMTQCYPGGLPDYPANPAYTIGRQKLAQSFPLYMSTIFFPLQLPRPKMSPHQEKSICLARSGMSGWYGRYGTRNLHPSIFCQNFCPARSYSEYKYYTHLSISCQNFHQARSCSKDSECKYNEMVDKEILIFCTGYIQKATRATLRQMYQKKKQIGPRDASESRLEHHHIHPGPSLHFCPGVWWWTFGVAVNN